MRNDGLNNSACARVQPARTCSGENAIERVDVSVDGGAKWQTAQLSQQKLPFAWRLISIPDLENRPIALLRVRLGNMNFAVLEKEP